MDAASSARIACFNARKEDAFSLTDRRAFFGQTFALLWGEPQTFFLLKNK